MEPNDERLALPTVGAASPSPAEVFRVLLNHGKASPFLTVRELGRLSICSKEIANIFGVEEAAVWKNVFERCANAGRVYQKQACASSDRTYQSWFSEPGLLECFSDPDPKILAKVGFKQAAGCLMGKSCTQCGEMYSYANPMTLLRMCKPCSNNDESSWFLSKSKAKEAFLLGERDLRDLPQASFQSEMIPGRISNTVVVLLSDVKETAFLKYGGADGLAAEFEARTRKAVERYNKSQHTSKPQKKRPKIERMVSSRPSDNQLRYLGNVIPVGVAFMENVYGRPVLKMTYAAKCNVCGRTGLPSDIQLHKRLEHGVDPRPHIIMTPPRPSSRPGGLADPCDIPGATQELIQLFSSASVTYTACQENEYDQFVCKKYSLVSFEGSQVTMSVDRWIGAFEGVGSGELIVSCQLGSGFVPMSLLHLSFGECMESLCKPFEASEFSFDDIFSALGLQQTNAAQFLVMLASRAMPLGALYEILTDNRHFAKEQDEHMTGRAMFELLGGEDE
jgi:predicted  nucleic acid-binding Zn-ribbon protein